MKVTKQIEEREILDEKGTLGEVIVKGTIVINTFPYLERTKKYEELMEGINTENPTEKDEFEMARRQFTMLKAQCESVDITIGEDIKVDNIDDLFEYAEGVHVGQQVARSLVGGQRLGKKKLN